MNKIFINKVSLCIGSKKILTDISLTFPSGKVTGIVGPNGSGKTTILKIISNILTSYSGEVFLGDRKFKKFNKINLAKKISYLPQEVNISWPISVYNTIMIGLIPYSNSEISSSERNELVQNIINELDLNKLSLVSVNKLSTGERARVCLARALVGCPDFLLADEPVSSLDPFYQLNILEFIKKRVVSGMGCIIVMHDLNLARRYCDNIVIINDGKVISNDKPDISLSNKNLHDIFAVKYDGKELVLSLSNEYAPT